VIKIAALLYCYILLSDSILVKVYFISRGVFKKKRHCPIFAFRKFKLYSGFYKCIYKLIMRNLRGFSSEAQAKKNRHVNSENFRKIRQSHAALKRRIIKKPHRKNQRGDHQPG
jgi:hypothetical protein